MNKPPHAANPSPGGREPTDATEPPAPRHLLRAQQLTLSTWRWAFARLCRELDPGALLPQVALQATLAILRGTDDPLTLFDRHVAPTAEFSLVARLLPHRGPHTFHHDVVDSAFLLRWNELTADGHGPQELPPLTPQLLDAPVRGSRPL